MSSRATLTDRVFVGSGDREHPLVSNQANGTINRFYMIKDTNVGLVGSDLGITDTCAGTVSTSCSDLFDVSGGGSVPADASGWSIKFAAGEQVVNGPLVVLGHALFGTNKPDTSGSSCNANLGIAQRYDVALSGPGFNDVTVTSTVAAGGGFLPPVVAGTVEIDGNKYLFTLDNPLNPGGPQFKPVPSNKRSRGTGARFSIEGGSLSRFVSVGVTAGSGLRQDANVGSNSVQRPYFEPRRLIQAIEGAHSHHVARVADQLRRQIDERTRRRSPSRDERAIELVAGFDVQFVDCRAGPDRPAWRADRPCRSAPGRVRARFGAARSSSSAALGASASRQ